MVPCPPDEDTEDSVRAGLRQEMDYIVVGEAVGRLVYANPSGQVVTSRSTIFATTCRSEFVATLSGSNEWSEES